MAERRRIIPVMLLCATMALSASDAFARIGRNEGGGNHGASYHRGNGGFYHGSYGFTGCRFWPYGVIDFSIVDPPIGSLFGYLPDGGTIVVVDGIGYYYINGYYLRQCPAGYIVVSPPMIALPAPAPVAQTQASPAVLNDQPGKPEAAAQKSGAIAPSRAEQNTEVASDDPIAIGKSITINIPNAKGGFTPVKLVKYKDGFIGPQDEFYSNHPTVDELRVLYGN